MDQDFIEAAYRAFDPYRLGSGTENVGPLMYSLVRLERYETVAEFGAGLTTLFLAKALADNQRDFVLHKRLLIAKVEQNREALTKALAHSDDDIAANPTVRKIIGSSLKPVLFSDGAPVAPNPLFYRESFDPRLFSWEDHVESDDYVQTLRQVLREFKLEKFVTLRSGAQIEGCLSDIPETRRPIGMAWNDFGQRVKFFHETYKHLSPQGGIVAFHSPSDFPGDIAEIKSELKQEILSGACEYLTLLEPHKNFQNGCFVVRRTGERLAHPKHDLRATLQTLLALRCDD
jgi:hypothetical protein